MALYLSATVPGANTSVGMQLRNYLCVNRAEVLLSDKSGLVRLCGGILPPTITAKAGIWRRDLEEEWRSRFPFDKLTAREEMQTLLRGGSRQMPVNFATHR